MAKKTERRVVVVTGGTRGIGRELVLRFAEAGCLVATCGRSKEKVAELKATLGRRHLVSVVDVARGKSVAAWGAKALRKFGAPDLVLNNAALMNAPAPLWKVPEKEFNDLVDVNVKGVANVVRVFLPAMIERGKGVVVNFSSGWGRGVAPEVAPYCATKWAIEGLTQALAEELPRGLAAIPLNPGIIDTDMLRSAWGEGAGRFPKPADWAAAAAPFLLSLGPEHNGQSLDAPTPHH